MVFPNCRGVVGGVGCSSGRSWFFPVHNCRQDLRMDQEKWEELGVTGLRVGKREESGR